MLQLAIHKSLAELKLHIHYLGPDQAVPQLDILRGINVVHLEGLSSQLGVGGQSVSVVSQIYEMCDREGWIKSSVYHSSYYNTLYRL